MSPRARPALCLALLAIACARTTGGAAADVAVTDIPAADVVVDAPVDRAPPLDVPAPPDAPSPRDAPRADVTGEVVERFACDPRIVASDFALAAGPYGTGRVVFDARRRALLVASFASGQLLRVAPDTGAVTRVSPAGFPDGLQRGEVFIDSARDALVVVPCSYAPELATQVLSLDLARLDRWESQRVASRSAPANYSMVAAWDDGSRTLRAVMADAPQTTRYAVWDLRATGTSWAWTRRADLHTGRVVELRGAAWVPPRAGILVIGASGNDRWSAWTVDADASRELTWDFPSGVRAPALAYDPTRGHTWALASSAPGGWLTAVPSALDGTSRTVTTSDRARALAPASAPLSVALDVAGRRLYAYADNTVSGRTSFLTELLVDVCLPP